MSHARLLTTREVADDLEVSTRQVARLVKKGALEPAAQAPGINGAYFFEPEAVEELKKVAS